MREHVKNMQLQYVTTVFAITEWLGGANLYIVTFILGLVEYGSENHTALLCFDILKSTIILHALFLTPITVILFPGMPKKGKFAFGRITFLRHQKSQLIRRTLLGRLFRLFNLIQSL